MEGRTLSHSLATTSGLARHHPHQQAAAHPRLRAPQRAVCRAVLDLTRPADAAAAVRQSPPVVEPLEQGETRVTAIYSPAEFEEQLRAHADQLVVLMCKAKCCRPCKMFARKYKLIADRYADAAFYEVHGDESKETRKMMVDMGVRVTPYFALFRGGERVHGHGGVNEGNLHRAIQAHLREDEAGFGSYSATADAEA